MLSLFTLNSSMLIQLLIILMKLLLLMLLICALVLTAAFIFAADSLVDTAINVAVIFLATLRYLDRPKLIEQATKVL